MLTEKDVTIVHNIIHYWQAEKQLPTIQELADSMGVYKEYVVYTMNKLVRDDVLIQIDEEPGYLIYSELFYKMRERLRKKKMFRTKRVLNARGVEIRLTHDVDILVPDEIDYNKNI